MTVLTVRELTTLAKIVDASRREVPVTWNGMAGRILTGTIRSLELPADNDVRQAQVRVSATFEHYWPIAEFARMVESGDMALDYRGSP
jgi:hypothetical protein